MMEKSYLPEMMIDENLGLLRRLWRGRIWYGAEWYITIFGALILLLVSGLTLFAPLVAPHDPNAFIGAAFTPPGGGPQALIGRTNGAAPRTLESLKGLTIGSQRGENGYNLALASQADVRRYTSLAELLAALNQGEVGLILVDQALANQVFEENPGLVVLAENLGPRYLLGTDNLGRDVVSRLVWGARTVLGVAIASALFSSTIGIALGLLAGFLSGALDRVLSLVMDSIYSFPGLLLAIAMAAMLGPGILNVAIAISVIYVPTFFRVVRGQVLSVKEELYVEAAESLGASRFSILTQYILPNVIPSVVVVFSLNIADAILTEAGLSFVGLGLPPDIPDWGYDLSKGHSYLVAGNWWMITFPGVMITLVAMGFSLLGEGLSEILNPRLVKN